LDLRRGRGPDELASVTSAEARLRELGIELPGLQPAIGNYLSAKRDGDLVFVSGHGPIKLDPSGLVAGRTGRVSSVADAPGAIIQGKVGSDLSIEAARDVARLIGLFCSPLCGPRLAPSIGSGQFSRCSGWSTAPRVSQTRLG
jgi:hypothetical protein